MATTFAVGTGQIPKSISEAGYASAIQKRMADIEDAYAKLFESVQDATPQIIYNALVPTKALAEYYTPVKTGKLRASSYLEVTSRGETPRVELGFAKGGDPPYGVYVHEMVQNRHAPPTRSKFLQAALLEDIDNVRTRIVNAFRSLSGVWG